MQSDQIELPVGVRYRAVGTNAFGHPSPLTWRAELAFVANDGLRHVRLVRSDDPRQTKVVSLDALFDPQLFEPL